MPAAVGPVAPRGPAANGGLAPMFSGPGGAPGPMGPMGFYPGAMGPQPPRGPAGEPRDPQAPSLLCIVYCMTGPMHVCFLQLGHEHPGPAMLVAKVDPRVIGASPLPLSHTDTLVILAATFVFRAQIIHMPKAHPCLSHSTASVCRIKPFD